MKFFTILSLLLGANAIGDGADMEFEASRELRRGGGRGGGRGHHGGGHHGGGHGGRRNHTEWLNQTCTTNNITCTEVDPEVLANCTYRHHHGGDGTSEDTSEDTDRELLVFEEASDEEDEELLELYDLFEGVDEWEEEWDEMPSTELRGSVLDDRDLKRKRHHEGGESQRHGKAGKWGNLTEAEREEMKLRHLTCKCCGNNTSS